MKRVFTVALLALLCLALLSVAAGLAEGLELDGEGAAVWLEEPPVPEQEVFLEGGEAQDAAAYADFVGEVSAEEDGDSPFVIEDGVLRRYRGSDINVTIPSGVTKIGNYAFWNNTELETVVIPEGVKEIGASAFQDCESLVSVKLPGSLEIIGYSAFSNCVSLEEIDFPYGLKKIGDKAFSECAMLFVVKLPAMLERLGENAFEDCSAMTLASLRASKLTFVQPGCFRGCTALETVELPDGETRVSRIGYYAFSGCKKLKNINLVAMRAGVGDFIGEHAFDGCESLESVMLADMKLTLYSYSFANCTSLESFKSGKGTHLDTFCESGTLFKNHNPNLVVYGYEYDPLSSEKELEWECKEQSIPWKSLEKTPLSADDISLSKTKLTYTGKALEPAVTVKVGGKTLKKDRDYTVSYKNNLNVGKGTVTVKGIGSYSGRQKLSFTIRPKASDILSLKKSLGKLKVTWEKVTDQVDGYQIQYSGNKDFTKPDKSNISDASKTSEKTHKLPASGKKLYVRIRTYKKVNGEKIWSAWSDVEKYPHSVSSLKKAELTLKKTSYTFNGKAKKPGVTVTLNGKTLKKGKDYTVSYSGNTKAGKAKCTVKGINKYKDSVTGAFKIKYDLSKAKIYLTDDGTTLKKTVKGKPIQPKIKKVVIVDANGKNVKIGSGDGYTVSYGTNVACGSGWVEIKGKGNCKGTGREYFTIIPPKPSGVKASTDLLGYVSVSWKDGIADYYELRVGTSPEISSAAQSVKITRDSCVDGKYTYKPKDQKAGTKYYFFVWAVKNDISGEYVKKSATAG